MWTYFRRPRGELEPPAARDGLPEPVEAVDFHGMPAKFFVPGEWSKKRVRKALTKDPEMIRWIDQIQASDTFWDVGANVGIFSLYAALTRRCKVFAFEPGAANYFVLNRNIELNGLQDVISAFCIAVAERSKFDSLNMRSTVPGSSLASFGEPIGPRGERFAPSFRQAMVSFALDDLAIRLPPPTHIKIDVDGIELSILAGGSTMLKDASLRSLIVELDPKRPELLTRAQDMLAPHGLKFSHSYEPQWEHIFVRG